jgi:hypothetical protein
VSVLSDVVTMPGLPSSAHSRVKICHFRSSTASPGLKWTEGRAVLRPASKPAAAPLLSRSGS